MNWGQSKYPPWCRNETCHSWDAAGRAARGWAQSSPGQFRSQSPGASLAACCRARVPQPRPTSLSPSLSVAQEVLQNHVLEAKVFHTEYGTGVAILTGAHRFSLATNIDDLKLRRMPEVPGASRPLRSPLRLPRGPDA